MLHQNDPGFVDTGVAIHKGWWRRPMADYAAQVRKHCHECGVPLRGYGELACAGSEGTEYTSETHAKQYQPKTKDRNVVVVTELHDLRSQSLSRTTDYLGNAKK